MSKRNKKRSVLKKRKRRINYNGIKPGNLVQWQGMKYKVVAKNDYRIKLDDVECHVDRETWNYI